MFYALRHKTDHSKWVGISTQAHDGEEFCNSVTAEFEFNEDIPFITTSVELLWNVINHIKVVDSSERNPELTDYAIRNRHANDYEIVELKV
ncbi:hypothetical protein [Aeromonas phage phiWae14]|nr:hypothetical protein [Aeromonas phage phiWae14]